MNSSAVLKLIRMWGVGAVLFVLRYLQINRDFDPETGLHTLSGIGIALTALIMAGGIAAFAFSLREKKEKPAFSAHFAAPNKSLLLLILGSFALGAGGAMLLADTMRVYTAEGGFSATEIARLATAVLAIIACPCFLLLTRQLRRGAENAMLALTLPALFFAAFWVLTLYLPSANDPVLARYCLPIVAASAAAYAFALLAGFFRKETGARMFSFIAECAVFLCIGAAAHLNSGSLLFIGCALLLSSFVVLRKKA